MSLLKDAYGYQRTIKLCKRKKKNRKKKFIIKMNSSDTL